MQEDSSKPAPLGAASNAQSCDSAALRVLLVEDDAMAANALARLLSRSWEVEIANDGASAISKGRAAAFHVVLLDLHLPDQSGFEVARALRGEGASQAAWIVALTGSSAGRSHQDCFHDFLGKPVDIDRLEQLLRAAQREVAECRPTRPIPSIDDPRCTPPSS